MSRGEAGEAAVDREHMRRALRLAERGRGRTSPNPLVGAVIVSPAGVIVGCGYHRRAGGPHAEIFALQEAGTRAKGGTLYCTLEPCAHQGRTGPCVAPIAAAGIRRVVIPMEDPNPLVSGRGVRYLRDHGVQVEVGPLSDQALALNRPFFTGLSKRRPHVTIKIAVSRDWQIAAAPGQRTSITGEAALRHAQRVRAEVDAVAVGSETALVDDPCLTVREVYRARPLVRVIFDRRLRTPPTARLFSTLGAGPVWVVTAPTWAGTSAGERRAAARALDRAGATLVCVDRYDLQGALGALHARGVQSLLVEGGAVVHRALWDAGLVDRVQIYQSPRPLGPGGVAWEMPGALSVDRDGVERTRMGDDLLIQREVRRE